MSQGARQILGDFRARVDFSTRKGLKRREKEVVARCCCLVVWCRLSLLSLFVLPLRLVRLSRSRSRSPIDQAPLLDPSNHPSIPPSFSPFHQLTPIDCPSLALPCPPIPNKHSHIHSLAHTLVASPRASRTAVWLPPRPPSLPLSPTYRCPPPTSREPTRVEPRRPTTRQPLLNRSKSAASSRAPSSPLARSASKWRPSHDGWTIASSTSAPSVERHSASGLARFVKRWIER